MIKRNGTAGSASGVKRAGERRRRRVKEEEEEREEAASTRDRGNMIF
jgi:hypothetical protein